GQWQSHSDNERRAEMPQHDQYADRRSDDSLHQRSTHCADRVFDEWRAVVTWDNADAGRQSSLDISNLLLDAVRHIERVLAVSHKYDTAGEFVAIFFEYSAARPATETDGCDVGHVNRHCEVGIRRGIVNDP